MDTISNGIPETHLHVDEFAESLGTIKQELVNNARMKAKAMRLEREAKDLRDQYKAKEADIYDSLFAAGLTSLKVDDDQYTLQEQIYGQIISMSDFMGWAEDQGRLDEFFELKPKMKLVNEFARELNDSAADFPPGLTYRDQRYISSPRKQNEEF